MIAWWLPPLTSLYSDVDLCCLLGERIATVPSFEWCIGWYIIGCYCTFAFLTVAGGQVWHLRNQAALVLTDSIPILIGSPLAQLHHNTTQVQHKILQTTPMRLPPCHRSCPSLPVDHNQQQCSPILHFDSCTHLTAATTPHLTFCLRVHPGNASV